jgi:hypothetical protein
MAPKEPATKTQSSKAQKKKDDALSVAAPISKQPKKTAASSKDGEKTPEKKVKPRNYTIVTRDHLKTLLAQISPNRHFKAGAGMLLLDVLNRAADTIIRMSVAARPHNQPSCLRKDVEVALMAFLPPCAEGQDGFRRHVKEEIDARLALIERLKKANEVPRADVYRKQRRAEIARQKRAINAAAKEAAAAPAAVSAAPQAEGGQ